MRQPYCSHCGHATARRIPAGDDRERRVCDHCGTIHYDNPKVVCGCLLSCGDALLLARRSIEPRRGFWTMPAGFMENRETTRQAALREAREEVLAEAVDPQLYGLISLPRISQVYVMYRATVAADGFGVGDESLAVALFAPEEVPWDELAFPVVEYTLRRYLRDRDRGRFDPFEATIRNRPGARLVVDDAVPDALREASDPAPVG